MSYYEQLLEKKGIKLSSEQMRLRNAWAPPASVYMTNISKEIIDSTPPSAFDKNGMRICCICHKPKPAEHYHKNNSRIDGRDARCKLCRSRLHKQKRSANNSQRTT